MKCSYALVLAVFLSLSFNTIVSAQSRSRAQIYDDMAALRKELADLEKSYLAPTAADVAAFSGLLSQPNTGLIRLTPGEKFDMSSDYKKTLTTIGSGSYFSFVRKSHEADRGHDIFFESNTFSTGYVGANYGMLLNLGDVPLEKVTAEDPAIMPLAAHQRATELADARVMQMRVKGTTVDGVVFIDKVPVELHNTYALRSVSFKHSDALVALRVVRKDSDGSIIVAWKLLRDCWVRDPIAPEKTSSTNYATQSKTRPQQLDEITAKRKQLTRLEKIYLEPAETDVAALLGLLSQPNTGVIRLLPGERFNDFVNVNKTITTRGGGSYYSFLSKTHEYGRSDIQFSRNTFRVGFAGIEYGMLMSLGDVPLEPMTAEYPFITGLAQHRAANSEPEARVEQARVRDGTTVDGVLLIDHLPVEVNTTYALRSVAPTRSDVLVALRVVRKDVDGSIIVGWKLLKNYPVSKLPAPTPPVTTIN